MDAAPEEFPETETATVVTAEAFDGTARLLSGVALALAALGLLELIGTITIGLAVKTSRLNLLYRQGYAFLTQLEKSPVGLMLLVAAVAAAVAMLRTRGDRRSVQLSTIALWFVIVSAVVLGVGTVLAVLARFRVAELPGGQEVDPVLRRILVVFVIRNFGTAVTALLVAVGAVFGGRARTTDVV